MFIELFPQDKPKLQNKVFLDQPYCSCFIYINSGSGSGLGSQILAQEIQKIAFNIPIKNQKDIKIIDVYFINLRKKESKQYGFLKLKELNSKNKKTIAVVCGGDGTVMWVVNQFKNFDIDPQKTPLTIIPTGTGNDFSRATNWGPQVKQLLNQNYKELKKLIRKWLNAVVSLFDIWDVTAQVQSDIGIFERVQKGQVKSLPQKIIKKSFVNYCSFGIDAKIGFSFDKHRSQSRLGNIAIYGGLGLAKSISKTKQIDKLVEQLYIKTQTSDICVFKSRLQSEPKQNQVKYISPNLQNILLLNIDSYAGGVQKIWQQGQQIIDKNVQRNRSSFSDGKIQMVSFDSALSLAMQRSIGGFAKRITQNSGPFIFKFRKYSNLQKHRTYLQIDGQYFRFSHPKNLVVQRSKLFKDSQITVLVNVPQKIIRTCC